MKSKCHIGNRNPKSSVFCIQMEAGVGSMRTHPSTSPRIGPRRRCQGRRPESKTLDDSKQTANWSRSVGETGASCNKCKFKCNIMSYSENHYCKCFRTMAVCLVTHLSRSRVKSGKSSHARQKYAMWKKTYIF